MWQRPLLAVARHPWACSRCMAHADRCYRRHTQLAVGLLTCSCTHPVVNCQDSQEAATHKLGNIWGTAMLKLVRGMASTIFLQCTPDTYPGRSPAKLLAVQAPARAYNTVKRTTGTPFRRACGLRSTGGCALLCLLLLRLERPRVLLGGRRRLCCWQDGLRTEQRWLTSRVPAP